MNCGKVDIVIVNWNSGRHLADLLSSIICYHSSLVASVVIVDNASSDDSLYLCSDLKHYLPFSFHIIRNDENIGYAAACNKGAALGTSEYLLFLNPDVRLFENSLSKPISFMRHPSNSSVAICGIRLLDENNNTSTCAARFPTFRVMAGTSLGLNRLLPKLFPAHLLDPSSLRDSVIVDQVIGAFFLVRRALFDRCAGFDERFFLYFEEVDLSLRLRKLGYSSFFLSDATAFHKGRASSDKAKSQRLFYWLRSRLSFAQKHYSIVSYLLFLLLTAAELPLRLCHTSLSGNWYDIKAILHAYVLLISALFRNSNDTSGQA